MKDKSIVLILITMALCEIMDGFDGSMVEVIVPTIASEFGASVGDASWIIIAYTMMVAALLLPFTKVADSGNIRKVFIVGSLIFAVGAFLGGSSTSMEMMIAARLIHGLGAAIAMSTIAMICVKFMPSHRRGFAFGIMVVSCAIGWSIGPSIGGIIADVFSWHTVFYMNVPLALFVAFLGYRCLPKEQSVPFKLDWPGIVLLSSFTVSMLLMMETLSDPGSIAVSMASAAVMVISIVSLIHFETKASEPLIGVRMLRNRNLLFSVISYIILSLIWMGLFYLFPFYIQLELDLPTSMTGLIMFIPSIITVFICVPIGGLCDKYGMMPFVLMSCILTLVYAVALMFVSPEMGWIPIGLIEIPMGIVWGLCGSSFAELIVDSADESDKGMASGMVNFCMYLSCALGPAVYATLMSYGSGLPGVPVDLLDPASFMDGFTFSVICSIIMAITCILLAYVVWKRRRSSMCNQS